MRKGITPPTVSISEMTHVQEDTHDNKMDEANFTDFEEYEQAPESVQVAEEKLQKGKEEVNDLKAQLEKEQDQIQDLGRRKSTLMEEVEDVKQTLEEREKQLDLIINLVPHMICAKNLEVSCTSLALWAGSLGVARASTSWQIRPCPKDTR